MDFIGSLRENGVKNFIDKINSLAKKYAVNNNVYYSVIPSKSYYINDNLKTPFDYKKMFKMLKDGITNAKYIDITSALTIDDYYITDPHWKQEKLSKVVDTLGDTMNFDVTFTNYTYNIIDNFIGQHGHNKENFPKEELVYLTNSHTENTVVTHIESGKTLGVYDLDKLSSDAQYDMFLSGPSAIVTLKNDKAKSDRELIIFRDSYSCSLAPLLTESYKEITLVDLRYVMSPMLDSYIKFENKDILFIYNDQIINNGEMLKVLIS